MPSLPKKILSITFLGIVCFLQTNAQNNQKALVAEVGKNGLVFNIFYDQMFTNNKWGFHGGGGTTLINTNFELRTATLGLFKLFGKDKNFFELGFDLQYHFADQYQDDVKGVTLVAPASTYEGVYPFAILGYRHYSKKGLLHAGFSPGVVGDEFIPGAYIGYGLILNRKQNK